MTMRFGLFSMPNRPPGADIYQVIRQQLDVLEHADDVGYAEAWLGEHNTLPWEPLPAGDLVIAQALQRTSSMMVCPGAYLVFNYHPGHLACRVMQLDHMAQGRLMCAFAPGFSSTDLTFAGLDSKSSANRELLVEALDVMTRVWTEHVGHVWEHEGHWKVSNPAPVGHNGPHLRPFQKPYPPIALAGITPASSTIELAGARGYIPISLIENPSLLAGHWTLYREAALAAGHSPNRGDWRVVRTGFVADTDAEAVAWLRASNHFRFYEKVIRGITGTPIIAGLKHDPSIPDEAVTPEYIMEHWWLVGSPETVAEKLQRVHDAVGGFGTVLLVDLDHGHGQNAYRRSLELFATEVIPRIVPAPRYA